jgi:N-acetylneuraminic acid mutarotase
MNSRIIVLAQGAVAWFCLSVSVATGAGWETVSCSTECTARHEAALTAINGKLYLLGGRGIKPVEEYDSQTRAWRKLAPTPMEFHHFQAVPVDGRIALVGAMTGKYPKEPPVTNIWWFDPAQDLWTQGPELPETRRRGGAGAVLHDRKLYLLCGITNGHWNGFVPWADALDLDTGQWTVLPDAPHARDHFQAVVVDGKIVCAGGRTSYAETKQTFNLTVLQVDVFDIASGQWTTLSSDLPTPRAGCMAVARAGWVVVLGGESASQPRAHAEVEALSLASGTWTSLPSLVEGRHGTGAAFVGDTLYVAAGCAKRGGGAEIHSMERWRWHEPAR